MASKQDIRRKVIGIPLNKEFDKNKDGTLLVSGFFTSDNKDEIGDIITRSATENALPKYRQWGNIRYMHMPKPVGKVTRIGLDDGMAWNEVEIKVIDPQAVFEVENDLLPALSVGILVNWEDIDFLEDGGWIINEYDLAEISLVDHPANYDARLKNLELTDEQRTMVREKGFSAFEDITSWTKGETKMADKVESTEEVIEELTEEITEEANVEDLSTNEPEAEKTAEDVESIESESDTEKTLDEEEETEVEETEVVDEVEEELETEEEEGLEVEEEELLEGETEVAFSASAEFEEHLIPAIEALTASVAKLTGLVEGQAEVPAGEQAEAEVEQSDEEAISVEDALKEYADKIAALEVEVAELKAPAERKGFVKVEDVETEEVETEETEEEGAEEVEKPANLQGALKAHFEAKQAK